MFSELSRVIEALGKERGVERAVGNAIEQAFLVTARKNTVFKVSTKQDTMSKKTILKYINIKMS